MPALEGTSSSSPPASATAAAEQPAAGTRRLFRTTGGDEVDQPRHRFSLVNRVEDGHPRACRSAGSRMPATRGIPTVAWSTAHCATRRGRSPRRRAACRVHLAVLRAESAPLGITPPRRHTTREPTRPRSHQPTNRPRATEAESTRLDDFDATTVHAYPMNASIYQTHQTLARVFIFTWPDREFSRSIAPRTASVPGARSRTTFPTAITS
ncbi:hypothetical protein SAMN04487904_101535 [Actinopolyspora lacussalsi subsp. righensis]|uniref:Uncharacterized protein n=1 Tax=Actinopolyspora righensis TaxID=995060 RepID=A0A1I6XET5_9ACTN|nr:hypothetical protein SAMN04487904_101535 [Actinopolyspora righensis]